MRLAALTQSGKFYRLSLNAAHLWKSALSFQARFQKKSYFTFQRHPSANITAASTYSSAELRFGLSQITNMASSVDKEETMEPSDTGVSQDKPMSKKAQKRLARWEKYQEIKRQRKEATKQAHKDDAGYCAEDLDQSDYFFENGLRKVYPYNFVFATHAKGRWVGRTIEDILHKEFGYDHEDDLKKSFDAGQIHVNNRRVGPGYMVRDCDLISHKTHRHENPVTWNPIEIIKDTDDLVVINKPSSIPCHPCGRYRFNSVVFILGKELGYTNLRNIYRLDRLTSGVLILAKTMEMTKKLEDQVVNRQVQKEYVCRVVGKFPDGPVVVDQPLRPLSNKLRLQVVCPSGKSSQTEFTRVSYNGTSSVVRCRPYTGRTHQIRVHLQYLGHPIINDAFYNNSAWGPNGGKGGDYEIPFDQVCATILREHHANLWDGGENPMYFEKLKEMNKADAGNSNSTSELSQHGDKLGNSDDALSINNSGALSCDKDVKDNSVVDENNVRAKMPSSDTCRNLVKSEEMDTANIDQSDVKSDKATLISAPEQVNNSSLVTSPASTDLLLKNNEDRNSPIDVISRNGKVNSVDNDTVKTSKQERSCDHHNATRPGFDKDRWSIDLLCELCKKLPIDPQEKNLVMFLHALKYKGPGWEYETELPDWAREDWCREEDYYV